MNRFVVLLCILAAALARVIRSVHASTPLLRFASGPSAPYPPASGSSKDGVPLHLCIDDFGCESLVCDANIAGTRCLFHVDIGYAGPPVLSTSYLAAQNRTGAEGRGSVQSRFTRAMKELGKKITDDDRHRAINRFLQRGKCRAYTAGCTMKLMGIAETSEMQADMLLCSEIDFFTPSAHSPNLPADVLVTHPLHGSVHILTCDYLMHRAPSVLVLGENRMHVSVSGTKRKSTEPTFTFHPAHLVGGAFCLPVLVGELALTLVVDTGAPAPVSLGMHAAKRLRRCALLKEPRHVTQVGVHGDRTCSTVVFAPMQVQGGPHHDSVQVLLNDEEVDGADGYLGMGFLRTLDLWIEPTRIGVRPNGRKVMASSTSKGSCAEDSSACQTDT